MCLVEGMVCRSGDDVGNRRGVFGGRIAYEDACMTRGMCDRVGDGMVQQWWRRCMGIWMRGQLG